MPVQSSVEFRRVIWAKASFYLKKKKKKQKNSYDLSLYLLLTSDVKLFVPTGEAHQAVVFLLGTDIEHKTYFTGFRLLLICHSVTVKCLSHFGMSLMVCSE